MKRTPERTLLQQVTVEGVLEGRTESMTTEEKLDWLLEKAKNGEMPFTHDKMDGIIKSLYAMSKTNFNEELKNNRHEYNQLLETLIVKDGLIEEHETINTYTLTVEGKLFKGYVKTKEDEDWNARLTKIQTYLVSVGAIFAIIFGSMEAHDRLTKSDQSSEAIMNHILLKQSEILDSVEGLSIQMKQMSTQDTSETK